ncbi:hypothetical protein GDO86_007100 [Hymenochirus boettgeri]|uniref:Uncharacterized protein n=1 Tax=Hymenochirus boettgeri TaxID=247094 RepID=A0A8T2ISG4_9PIPI|nr:hypothetical protein GDO86_007100 [Hymenochirus boettgeri]
MQQNVALLQFSKRLHTLPFIRNLCFPLVIFLFQCTTLYHFSLINNFVHKYFRFTAPLRSSNTPIDFGSNVNIVKNSFQKIKYIYIFSF